MVINNVQFDCTIDEVIEKLQQELKKRGINLLFNGILSIS